MVPFLLRFQAAFARLPLPKPGLGGSYAAQHVLG
jgi:hypothetical protein